MAVWLVALAAEAPVPRRLVWIVDRRVVVDQTTSEAEQLALRIGDANDRPLLREVSEALANLSLAASNGEVVTVSTLRGEREDNRGWSKDPSRPAIIVGTVDMVGSRLLFSGYGDGKSRRSSHAGLLGHDVLLVNDEAHLTSAFASLLGKVLQIQKQTSIQKPVWIMRLSATHQSGHPFWPDSLEKDRSEPRFCRNLFSLPAESAMCTHAYRPWRG